MPVQRHGFHNPNTKKVDRICSLNSEKNDVMMTAAWLKALGSSEKASGRQFSGRVADAMEPTL